MTQDTPRVVARKKLIEVALPLDAINKASAREKSIRHGHPSTLHLWWARRPLAAARAVIFAQMVDDPSANPDLFPTDRAQARERLRLFRILEDIVTWENSTNEEVLQRARNEIWQSWRRDCADNADHPQARELFDRHVLPAFHDPFAGGGSLPLEAQRLGLNAHASDLNPVAVLINKAMIEVPPIFEGRRPVNPEAQVEARLIDKDWRGAEGLADDVSHYGTWIRHQAKKRIGHLYPKVYVNRQMATDRPDLEPYVGRELTVIAWLWARTVKSPNPAFADIDVPLASTFVLSRKAGNEAYVEPVITNQSYSFAVKSGTPPEESRLGTTAGKRRAFRCLLSGVPVTYTYIQTEGKAGRLGSRLMAMVAEGDRSRVYLSPTEEHESIPSLVEPNWRPQTLLPNNPRDIKPPIYGMSTFGDLFSDRQLLALNTLSQLVAEVRKRIYKCAGTGENQAHDLPQRSDEAEAPTYAEAVALYLALAIDKCADYWSTICTWHGTRQTIGHTFGRQAIPMTWDYAEANPFCNSSGNIGSMIQWVVKSLTKLPSQGRGIAWQADAQGDGYSNNMVYSTDPPYYDNIGYANLSDYFYIWLRRTLKDDFPDLFSTLAAPKVEELIASPYRHDSRQSAEVFFLNGMTRVMRRLARQTHPSFPVTIYYALKQSETRTGQGVSSTGWETFLGAVLDADLCIQGTWPIRTELPNKLAATRANVLASSIVLVCRPRTDGTPDATRREFLDALRHALPRSLQHLQRSNIAPVDLAQASIGPGMSVFSRYRKVLNADGSRMSVGDALALINATLDEVFAEQEGDFDADSRWALTWFEQHGLQPGEYGVAEQLSKAKNTSVEGLVRAGIIESWRGGVRLLAPEELDPDWDPGFDRRLTVWEMTHHLIRLLAIGEERAAQLVAQLGARAGSARDLAYRLYTVSERNRRPADALQYNGLVQSWPEIARLARQRPGPRQTEMLSQAEDGP